MSTSNTPHLGNAEKTIKAEIEGEKLEIAFNIKYLVSGLKTIPGEKIQILLNEWNQPAIFKSLERPNIDYLVMPVQIKN